MCDPSCLAIENIKSFYSGATYLKSARGSADYEFILYYAYGSLVKLNVYCAHAHYNLLCTLCHKNKE